MDEIYYFEAICVKPIFNKDKKKSVELLVVKGTNITVCDEPLRSRVLTITPESSDGARMWTNVMGSRRDYAKEPVQWYSLSVCETICAPDARRQVNLLVKVPSVFILSLGGKITYWACSQCKKSWPGEEPQRCACTGASRVLLWKADVTLFDNTAQVKATFFDALASVVEEFADGDSSKTEKSYFEDEEQLDSLLPKVAAIPFTIIFSFEDNDFDVRPQLIARLVAPTFNAKHGVLHPLAKMVRFETKSSQCPPCKLEGAKFDPGCGLICLHGSSTCSIRVLLEVLDAPSGARRGDGAALRVTRRCACALRGSESTQTYTLVQHGPLEITTLLFQVRKCEFIHAIVTWRTADELTLIAFYPLCTDAVTKFRQFFKAEVSIHIAMMTDDDVKLERSDAETPLRIAATASTAAASARKHDWAVHATLDQE